MSPDSGVADGPDGKPRCWWALGTADYIDYHDSEWGRPLHEEAGLYERLTLEAFQSGLSWLTILRKRENFRRAFDGFDIEQVEAYGDNDVERLMADEGIVRNRKKIDAAITNAHAARELHTAGETPGRADLVLRAGSRLAARAEDGCGPPGDHSRVHRAWPRS